MSEFASKHSKVNVEELIRSKKEKLAEEKEFLEADPVRAKILSALLKVSFKQVNDDCSIIIPSQIPQPDRQKFCVKLGEYTGAQSLFKSQGEETLALTPQELADISAFAETGGVSLRYSYKITTA